MTNCPGCKRTRYSKVDLKRWQDEIDAFCKAGGDGRYFNPEWARPLCWTIAGSRCNSRPQED